jgi:glutamine synthetase
VSAFIDKFGLWTDAQRKAAVEVDKVVQKQGLGVIRLSAADQHGILRGKTVTAAELGTVFRSGCTFVSSLLAKDTSCRSVFPVFTRGGGFGLRGMEGAADLLMVPDPTSFRVLPWAPHSGWMLCDLYFGDGKPVPLSTRQLYRSVLERLHAAGLDYVAGLEVEFHVFKLVDAKLAPADSGQPGNPPEVGLLTHGYQLLAEERYDVYDTLLEILRGHLEALGLPLRSLEVELGPSQVEFTFRPCANAEPADAMILLRSAVKQICRRHGCHATFMCRPKLPNICSSGWHLHQSLRDRKTGANVFVPEAADATLSAIGRHYMAGLLAHAAASAAFATPTLNGYKRYRPFALAPDRVTWGEDNRGAMVRALGRPGDSGSRLENRIGEPAANPYLYMASQILAGLDGLARKLDPGPRADTPYEAKVALLPRTLGDALQALRSDDCYCVGFGDTFIDYFVHIKEAEIARYRAEVGDWKDRDPLEVTDWEHREYFDLF